MRTVERWDLQPSYSSGRIPSRSQWSLRWSAITLRSTLPVLCHEGNATTTITFQPIFLLMQHLVHCSFPLLRRASSPPSGRDYPVKVSQHVRVFFVGQDLEEFSREAIRSNRLLVHHRPDSFCYLVPGRKLSSGLHGVHIRSFMAAGLRAKKVSVFSSL